MGLRSMRAPTFALPSSPPPPHLPHRSVLLRYEASLALTASYESSLRSLPSSEGDCMRIAQVAHDLLLLIERRRSGQHHAAAAASSSSSSSAAAAATLSDDEAAWNALSYLTTGGLDDGGAATDSTAALLHTLDAVEAEGWEAHRTDHPIGGRMVFGQVCAMILTTHVSLLEKRKQYGHAAYLLQVLLRCPFWRRRRGQWWSRLAVDRDHLGREDGTLKADAPLLLAAITDPHLSPSDVVDLARRAHKLADSMPRAQRRLLPPLLAEPKTVVVGARRLRHGGGGRVLYTSVDDAGGAATCTVEELVLSIYRDEGGWEGLHVESGVHLALFALLMWGLLFDAPQPPHAFTSRFQDAPHDLCGEDGEFANARRVRLDERLASLRAMSGEQIDEEVRSSFQERYGTRCRGISWEAWGERSEVLAELAGCLGGIALAAICECFAEDYGGWHGGMPDLIVWQRSSDSSGGNGWLKLLAASLAPTSCYGEARLRGGEEPLRFSLRSAARMDRPAHAQRREHRGLPRRGWCGNAVLAPSTELGAAVAAVAAANRATGRE